MTKQQRPLHQLVEIVDRLRGPDGCPWDQEQTLKSMPPYLLEEVYELLEAMETDGGEDGLEGELGDLLFVVLLITRIGTDMERLTLDSVCSRIVDKMIERHPHVFGAGDTAENPGGIAAWEARKNKNGRSRLAGVPRALPALLRAHRQGEKAAAVGFDWPDIEGVFAKVEEELTELREAVESGDAAAIRHEYGDVLLAASSLGRHLQVPPESSLRQANDRFADRFSRLEALAKEEGVELSGSTDAQTLDRLWERVKQQVGT